MKKANIKPTQQIMWMYSSRLLLEGEYTKSREIINQMELEIEQGNVIPVNKQEEYEKEDTVRSKSKNSKCSILVVIIVKIIFSRRKLKKIENVVNYALVVIIVKIIFSH